MIELLIVLRNPSRPDVIDHQIREVADDLDFAGAACEHVEYIGHPHPRSGHDWSSAADKWIDGDPREIGDRRPSMIG